MPLSCVKLLLGRKVLGRQRQQEKLTLQAQHEEEWRTEVEAQAVMRMHVVYRHR